MNAEVIALKERNFFMLKNDLIFKNPLSLIEEDNEILPEGGMGAVLARSGVGKTSVLVQLALYGLLENINVLHISLTDPVKKVCLWYDEVFKNIAERYEIKQMVPIWEEALKHRFIMTFKVEGFSVPRLEERLTDLTEQDVFFPRMMLIDGLAFENETRQTLLEFRQLAKQFSLRVWFTVKTHREENTLDTGLPVRLEEVNDLFDRVLLLKPAAEKIDVCILKGKHSERPQPIFYLDPKTLLVTDRAGEE